jgi:hypothetical protein
MVAGEHCRSKTESNPCARPEKKYPLIHHAPCHFELWASVSHLYGEESDETRLLVLHWEHCQPFTSVNQQMEDLKYSKKIGVCSEHLLSFSSCHNSLHNIVEPLLH